jgi:hypothetical protein
LNPLEPSCERVRKSSPKRSLASNLKTPERMKAKAHLTPVGSFVSKTVIKKCHRRRPQPSELNPSSPKIIKKSFFVAVDREALPDR